MADDDSNCSKTKKRRGNGNEHHLVSPTSSPPSFEVKEKNKKNKKKKKVKWTSRWGEENIRQDGDDPWVYSSTPVHFSKDAADSGLPCMRRVLSIDSRTGLPELYHAGWWILLPSAESVRWVLQVCEKIIATDSKVMVDPQLFAGEIFPCLHLTEKGDYYAQKYNSRSHWPRWNCLADVLLLLAVLEGRTEILQWLAQMVMLHSSDSQQKAQWEAFIRTPPTPQEKKPLTFSSWSYHQIKWMVRSLDLDFYFTLRGIKRLFVHVSAWSSLWRNINSSSHTLFTLKQLCELLPSDHLFVKTATTWTFDQSASELVPYEDPMLRNYRLSQQQQQPQ